MNPHVVLMGLNIYEDILWVRSVECIESLLHLKQRTILNLGKPHWKPVESLWMYSVE